MNVNKSLLQEAEDDNTATGEVKLGGKEYTVKGVIKTNTKNEDAVHIILPGHDSIEMTRLAVECIKKYTDKDDYVLWVVDNFSNKETREATLELEHVNILCNLTKVGTWYRPWYWQPYGGSTSNAVALGIAAAILDKMMNVCRYLFVMHNDSVPVKKGWLPFLKSKLNDKVKIAGVSQDTARVHAIHQSGFLFDFRLYKELGMSFMHNMPEYDVGDMITLRLRENGYGEFFCQNTFNRPANAEFLNTGEYPDFVRKYRMDKSFDDDRNLIYMHLGRGTAKNRDEQKEGRMTKQDWINCINHYYLRI